MNWISCENTSNCPRLVSVCVYVCECQCMFSRDQHVCVCVCLLLCASGSCAGSLRECSSCLHQERETSYCANDLKGWRGGDWRRVSSLLLLLLRRCCCFLSGATAAAVLVPVPPLSLRRPSFSLIQALFWSRLACFLIPFSGSSEERERSRCNLVQHTQRPLSPHIIFAFFLFSLSLSSPPPSLSFTRRRRRRKRVSESRVSRFAGADLHLSLSLPACLPASPASEAATAAGTEQEMRFH